MRIPPDTATVDQHEQRFRALFTDGPAGQAFSSLDGRLCAANAAFCRILGREPADVVGRTYVELTLPDDRARNLALVDELLAGHVASFQMVKRYIRGDGSPVRVLNTVTLIDAPGEQLMAAVCIELREHKRLRDPVHLDIMTGTRAAPTTSADAWLHDWRVALDPGRVNCLWDAVAKSGHDLVWAVDTEGRLRYVSDAAFDVLGTPPDDVIGKSLFDLIHPDDVSTARRIFTTAISEKTGWERVRLRAVRPDGSASWLESNGVAHVDDRHDVVGFTATTRRLEGDDARAAEVTTTRQLLAEVVMRRQLHTVWQPIFSLSTGQIVGAEALARFSHPDVVQSPDRWFAQAHDVGMGEQLELLAVETALAAAAALPDRTYVSLNVSPATVASGRLASVIENGAVPPDRAVLELTEHVSIDDYDLVAAALDCLRSVGVRLAVDDAGAGFASFRHILRLKPDIIKLDQSITRGIDENAAQRALAAALVMFGIDVGSITVIAEGVETEAELSTVSTLGIDAVQGYYLARPKPVDELDFDTVAPHAWVS